MLNRGLIAILRVASAAFCNRSLVMTNSATNEINSKVFIEKKLFLIKFYMLLFKTNTVSQIMIMSFWRKARDSLSLFFCFCLLFSFWSF